MLIARALTFFLFLLLAAGMGAWQVQHLTGDAVRAETLNAALFAMILGPSVLFAEFLAQRALRGQTDRTRIIAYALAGVSVLPLTALVAGGLSLIMARGGNHRRIWASTLAVGALIGLNIVACIGLGFWIYQGQLGLSLGLTCVKVQFFLVIDYFLVRSIWHYFGSGASAFISLRYLRRRVISLLSVAGIAVGVAVLIIVNSIMTGFQTDFREQIRGSSSHLLVRFDSDQFHPRGIRAQELEWAEYVRRIEAEAELKSAWELELDNASKRALDEKLDATAVVARLRSGRDLSTTDLKCLRDGGKITTARDFFLDRKLPADTEAAKKAREAMDEEARSHWFYPEFRRRMQEAFDGTEAVLKAHTNARGEPDVTGISWRLSVKTVITPKNKTTELPIAELTGVDLARETSISSLGDYIAQAETQYFKTRYVLHPLQQVLGSLFGFESDASLEKLGAPGEFRFSTKGIASQTSSLPYDMRRLLKMRRVAASNDKISWDSFDEVRFFSFTPGQALYDRAKEAYKRALRTHDLEQLQRIAEDANIEIREILESELKRPPPAGDEEAMSRTGCKIILEQYLTGVGQSERRLRDLVNRYVDAVAAMARDEDQVPAEEKAWVVALWEKMKSSTEARKKAITSLETSEVEREDKLLEVLTGYISLIESAIEEGRNKAPLSARSLEENFTLDAKHARSELPFSDEAYFQPPRPLPLAYAVERIGWRIQLVKSRQEAYRQVIPLRSSMGAGESAEDYIKRATKPNQRPGAGDLPGIILGEALAESGFMGGINVGDTIALTIPRIYLDENGRLVPRATEATFRVTGFFRSGLYEDNLGRMYCDFDELARLMADSNVRYIVGAKFKDYTPYEGEINSMKLKRSLHEDLRRAGVVPATMPGVWEDEKKSLLEAVDREKLIVSLIVGFILVLAGALIVIVVYQLVSEKVKDIGILKALGHSPWGIRSVFMFNALFIGLFGAVIGAALGITFSQYLNEIEDFIDRATGIRLFPPDIYFLTYIPSVKGWNLVLLSINIGVPAVLWSFACGILPALTAARKDPVEALHHE